MKSELIILTLLFIHWIADFLLQNSNMATKKSKNIYWLATHVAVYSITFFFLLIWFYDFKSVAGFTGFMFITHYITDFYSSRATNKLYQKKKFYGLYSFFNVIGFDQFLHQAQIILGYLIFFT